MILRQVMQDMFLKGAAVHAFYRIRREQQLSRSALDRLVTQRLQHVLLSAYQHVPWYREQMEHIGYDPAKNFQGVEDLQTLPLLRRSDLKERDITDFVRSGTDLSRAYSALTSGSTGMPLRIYQSAYDVGVRRAKSFYVGFINHCTLRDRTFAPVSPGRMHRGNRLLERLGLSRTFTLNYLKHSPAELVDRLLEYQPDILYGNRSHLDLMALELRRRGIPAEQLGLKCLFGGAEVFHESSKRLYREQFGVELTDVYGSMELAIMAYETPAHDGFHLFESLFYYECLDDDGNPAPSGVPGRLAVTDLTRTLMPFIRYEQGDRVIFTDKEPERRIARVLGRDPILLRLPNGTVYTEHRLTEILELFEGIVQFRVIQRALDFIEIQLVAEPEYIGQIHDSLLQRFQNHLSPSVHFTIVRVENIAPEPNGKLRAFISDI